MKNTFKNVWEKLKFIAAKLASRNRLATLLAIGRLGDHRCTIAVIKSLRHCEYHFTTGNCQRLVVERIDNQR